MAILRAAATANFTLDNTGTATLITGLTLTPASDDYLLSCTIEFLTPSAAPAATDTFSVWVGGTQIAHSQRFYDGDTSVDNASITYALTCKVSPNGSQDVEIRHTRSSSSAPCIASKREMTLFPMPASGTDYEDSATATDTVASSTYSVLDSMTRTPASGDYLAVFSSSVEGPSGAASGFRMRVGGTVQTHTLREIFYESSAPDVRLSVMLIASITANGSQAVDIQFNRPTGAGTITVHHRTMNLIPVASADIDQASGTADDTDSTTTDKLLDDMTITDPGADDYLTMFSMTIAWGTLAADQGRVTMSVHEGGAVVTDTDRDNEVEDSLDNSYMSAYTGGRVTVGGATDDLEIFWQGASTQQRTGRERTFIAMKEASATTHTADGSPSITIPTASGAAEIINTATGAPSIAIPTASGAAEILNTATGAPEITIPTAAGAAEIQKTATGAPEIAIPTAAGAAEIANTATGAPSIAIPTAAGTTALERNATGAPSAPLPTAAGTTALERNATGAPSTALITAAGTASVTAAAIEADGAPSIAIPTAAGTTNIERNANGAPAITIPTAAGVAEVANTATGAPSITIPTAAGASEVIKTATGAPSIPLITAAGDAHPCSQTLAPDSIAAITGLSGDVTDIDEPVSSPDANWLLLAA